MSLPIAFGGVVIYQGKVLLRQPDHQKGGYAWTFPKRTPKPGDNPEETALKGVGYKTGLRAQIVQEIPGVFPGGATQNVYYLMEPVILGADAELPTLGTSSVRWASQVEAVQMICETKYAIGRTRDLEVLLQAYRQYDALQAVRNVQLVPHWWTPSIESYEHDILTHSALRFAGYEYQRATGWDVSSEIRRYELTGEIPEGDFRRLTMFFMLQRYLFKWGGEYLTDRSRIWHRFRELYLQTCALYIPPEYRYQSFYAKWEREHQPRLQEHAALVRLIHAGKEYQAGDELDPGYVAQIEAFVAQQAAQQTDDRSETGEE